jgi:hypothetical protein
MAVSEELIDFVKEGLRQRIPREDLRQALLGAGWMTDEVNAALGGFADDDFPIPVPRPRPYVSAWEIFVYLVLFTTLYVSAYNLGSLLFELIEVAFPDPADRDAAMFRDQRIRWAISSLVVALPVFLYMTSIVGRAVRTDPTKRASKIRRHLTYLSLFIASCVLIGDGTALVYNALGGDLTVRFVLKVLVVAAIAGTGFTYYLQQLRSDEKDH